LPATKTGAAVDNVGGKGLGRSLLRFRDIDVVEGFAFREAA
jgi:hypothetical protein